MPGLALADSPAPRITREPTGAQAGHKRCQTEEMEPEASDYINGPFLELSLRRLRKADGQAALR